MKSQIAERIHLATHPVALTWSNSQPDSAKAFSPGKNGCVLTMFAQVAIKGTTAVFSRDTYGCYGGGVGLGFGNRYEDFPGEVECFCHFLSTGNKESEKGRAIGANLQAASAGRFAETFLHGERYVKNPTITQQFVNSLPMIDIPTTYVLLKPLEQCVQSTDDIKAITFFVNPDQFSAIIVLANYLRPAEENVGVPWGAACQVAGIFAYRELTNEHPRALVGLTDISARKYTRASLGEDTLAITLPFSKFLEMESCVEGSFLEGELWESLITP